MESQEEREEKKNSNKALAIFAAIFIVAAAAFGAYKYGLIPGFGEGNKVAQELAADIQTLKGENVKGQLIALIEAKSAQSKLTPEQKAQFTKDLNEAFATTRIGFDFASLLPSSGDGKGTVDINSPKLVIGSTTDTNAIEIASSKFIVSRSVADKNNYFSRVVGPIDVTMSGKTTQKLASITTDQFDNEVKLDDEGNVKFSKSAIKKLAVLEGRGGTVLFTVEEINAEGSQVEADGKLDAYVRTNIKNIVPGDMLKAMLGAIEPITINLDYAYKGEDYNDYISRMAGNVESAEADSQKIKAFDGSLTVKDVSILMGTAGISGNANLEFKKDNEKAIPTGVINVKIAQYQKLIDYFKKFFPIPQDQIDRSVQFFSEIGTNAGGDISVVVKLDGTEKIMIGDKTMEEVKAIQDKYYPSPKVKPTPGITSPDSVQSAPPAPVTSREIPANQTRI